MREIRPAAQPGAVACDDTQRDGGCRVLRPTYMSLPVELPSPAPEEAVHSRTLEERIRAELEAQGAGSASRDSWSSRSMSRDSATTAPVRETGRHRRF